MLVIAIVAPKGGACKSTLALSLAVHAFHEERKVAVLDLNSDQENLQRWAAARAVPGPKIVEVTTLTKDIRRLESEDTDVLIIDTPPVLDMSGIVESAVAAAALVLVPARPSTFDVHAVEAAVELCAEYKRPFAFVVCAAATTTPQWKALAENTARALRKLGRVLPGSTYRTSYVNALTKGLTAGEIDKVAAKETADIWNAAMILVGGRA